MSDEYSKLRDAAAEDANPRDQFSDSFIRNLAIGDWKNGADWGYEKGRAEIRSRIAAMEAEVTAAENKTRTVQANAKEEIERLTRELAEARLKGSCACGMWDGKFEPCKYHGQHYEKLEKEVERLKAEVEALRATCDLQMKRELAKRQGEPAKCDHERVMTNGCCYFCGVDLSAKPASAASPREWWISDECKYVEVYVGYPEPDYSSKWTHVIEYVAYQKLREENERMRDHYDKEIKQVYAFARTNTGIGDDAEIDKLITLTEERDALKAECEKLADELFLTLKAIGYTTEHNVALTNYAAFKEKISERR